MRTTTVQHGEQAPEGYHWVAALEPTSGHLGWRLSDGQHRCRYGATRGKPACGQPAVARLNRGNSTRERWWHYCEQHMFGRWIEDGQVYWWRLRKIGEDDQT